MSVQSVQLRGYPVRLGLAVAEHVEEWLREFALVRLAGERGGEHEVPARLQQMVADLTGSYGEELSEPERVRDEAAARGQETVDLVYPVRPQTEQAVRAWQTMLEQVDAYCRDEDLLTLARPPEQVALNDWVLDEFARQLRGEPPAPWEASQARASVPR